VIQARVVPLDSWVPAACKVLRATWASPVRWEFKASLAFPAPSAPWASRGLSVPRVSQDRSVFVASRVRMAPLVCVAPPVPLAQLVPSAFVARLVLLAFRASKVPLVSRVTPVLRASRATPVRSDPRAPLACLVHLVPTARMESLDLLVPVAIVARKVSAVLPVPQALKA